MHFGFNKHFFTALRALALIATIQAIAATETSASHPAFCQTAFATIKSARIDLHAIEERQRDLRSNSIPGGKSLRIEIHPGLTELRPRIVSSSSDRVLVIPSPEDVNLSAVDFEGWVRQLLVGHPSHPFISGTAHSSGPALQLRDVQAIAIETLIAEARAAAVEGRSGSLLYIAPTATGKSEVLLSGLSHQLDAAPNGLHLVVADLTVLTRQLATEARVRFAQRATLIEWGGDSKPGELLGIINRSRFERIILVTSVQSLKARVKRELRVKLRTGETSDELAPLAEVLRTFAYDEAHHAGAPEAAQLIASLQGNSEFKALTIGTTATPVNREYKLEQIFKNRSHWAYVDSRGQVGPVHRPLTTIIDQLETAVQQGELTPFGDLHLLLEKPDSTQVIINREYIDQMLYQSGEIIRRNKRGFVSVASIEEAELVAEALSKSDQFPYSVEALHSKLSTAEQAKRERAFRNGEIDYLVTVRKLDEGVDYPSLSLYIDLNSTIGVRPLIQRMGRVLRLAVGKESVDMISRMRFDENTVRESLALLEVIAARRLSGLGRADATDSTRNRSRELLQQMILELRQFWGARKFVPYEEARAWAIGKGVRSAKEWTALSKSGELPPSLPRAPHFAYQNLGWTGWRHYLGKAWAPFDEVKSWAIENKVESMDHWYALADAQLLPKGFPKYPHATYASKGWQDSRDFLGKKWLSFDEARSWAIANQVQSGPEWVALSKAGRLAEGLPSNPNKIYRTEGWRGWAHFLGRQDRWISFQEASQWAQSQNVESSTQWRELVKNGSLPTDIPRSPDLVYKNKGWRGWAHFLGTELMSYELASQWAVAAGIKSQRDWVEKYRVGATPKRAPVHPAVFYKDTGWVSWDYFLNRQRVSFEDAQNWAIANGVKSSLDWTKRYQSGRLPEGFPSEPNRTFRNRGWQGWHHFLQKRWRSFEEARSWAIEHKVASYADWLARSKRRELPSDIPSAPHQAYKDKGWRDWAYFLGQRI